MKPTAEQVIKPDYNELVVALKDLHDANPNDSTWNYVAAWSKANRIIASLEKWNKRQPQIKKCLKADLQAWNYSNK